MIEVVGLTKKYGNRLALNNISFNVNKGEIIGFLGPNGAGKSTTMNILTGYISMTNGTVKIDGIDILEDPINAKKKIGYLPETPPLYMDMKVREYLNFVFELKKVKQNKRWHISEICELVKLTDVSDRLIKNLSKGFKQRVGLAQALIGAPELLILDEPTVGLDPKQIIEIRTLIKKLGEEHTVILSSHILSEIQAVCDKVIIINKGTIVANEQTQNLYNTMCADPKILLGALGNQNEIYNILLKVPDVKMVEKLEVKNGEEFKFIIHPQPSKDIRKNLSKAVTDAGNIIVELKSLDLTLEEVFLKLTDGTLGLDYNTNLEPEEYSNVTQNENINDVEIVDDVTKEEEE